MTPVGWIVSALVLLGLGFPHYSDTAWAVLARGIAFVAGIAALGLAASAWSPLP